MFDSLALRKGPAKLALQTRKGADIENEIALEPEAWNREKYERYRRLHPNWINRKGPCGTYNCSGHVFASRRTAIYPDKEIEKILRDDGYRLCRIADCMVGDVVIYRAQGIVGIIHLGQIVEVSPGNSNLILPRILVLSKWDDTAGEDRHVLNDVPFTFDGKIEIWTDRE